MQYLWEKKLEKVSSVLDHPIHDKLHEKHNRKLFLATASVKVDDLTCMSLYDKSRLITMSADRHSTLSNLCWIRPNSPASSTPVYSSRALRISFSVVSRKYWLYIHHKDCVFTCTYHVLVENERAENTQPSTTQQTISGLKWCSRCAVPLTDKEAMRKRKHLVPWEFCMTG